LPRHGVAALERDLRGFVRVIRLDLGIKIGRSS
jgi:hypothetical protein